jgi:hypothetical protein
MPQLENPQHERVAINVSRGGTWTAAVEKAGYSNSNRNVLQSKASYLKRRPEIAARVAELQGEIQAAVQEGVTASASTLDYEAKTLYEKFTHQLPIGGPGGKKKRVCECGKSYFVNVWKFDGKNALSALDLRAKLAGLYVKNINVRHGKIGEIEGTLDQIWERVADMAEPLGREFKEWLIARWGYEVVPGNLRVIEGTRVVEGAAEDVTEAAETAS